MNKTPIDTIFDSVQWTPVPPPADTSDGIPYATHKGVLQIVDLLLDVVVLNTGERLITEESLVRFFNAIAEPKEPHAE